MDERKLSEEIITDLIKKFLINKINGNWHEDKIKEAKLHNHGADLILVGGKRSSECFTIECKGKSYTKSAAAINKESWLNALGQLITRMNTQRIITSGKNKGAINRAYKYGLGLYWVGAKVALRRIPKNIAQILNLYVFSVNEEGFVKQWTPSQFGESYKDDEFEEKTEMQ